MDFTQARENMVDCQIHPSGVTSEGILESFLSVPREEFVPQKLKSVAYADEDLQIDSQHFLLEPAVHAKMIQAVNPGADDVVLDVGAGTGYSSAILSPLVTTVISLESHKIFLDKAFKLWSSHGFCNVAGVKGPLTKGNPENAPYSLIVMNGAVPEIPEDIVQQLTPEGRMVVIVKKPGQVMGQAVLVKKTGKSGFSFVALFEAGSPYLAGYEPAVEFQF